MNENTLTQAPASTVTRRLLTCGVVAGPLYVLVAGLQVLTRDGFDLGRHPLSLLSVGDLGWIQIANFVVSGLLFVASAVGMRRALRSGRASTWGPRLVGTFGVGLVWAGVFVADPADGFPAGTPAGTPTDASWHAILHNIAPAVAFLALIAACFVFARRFAQRGQRGWAAYSAATGSRCSCRTRSSATAGSPWCWRSRPSSAGAGRRRSRPSC
ncbi:MAG: DUF998 domain-containing protein [Propionibacteriales bacterium]|nr:DUF998 domain-containing protein [Propionibacteriales bacterium]